MPRTVTLIQGGGIGLDQEQAARRVVAALGVPVEFDTRLAGLAAIEAGQPPLPSALFDAVRNAGLALKTKLLHPPGGGPENFNIHFRRDLGLFASVRPIHNFAGLPGRFPGLDLLLVREITEDLYSAIEHEIVPGVVQSIKVVTEAACNRFFEFTFALTRRLGRKTVHCVHKANILKQADGLFLDCFRRVAARNPDLTPKEIIIDNCCMQLVARPAQFDVLASGNLYGDLLSDLGAGLIGGISATAAINHGPGVTVYEAIHGGPVSDVGGPGRANPLPLLTPLMHLLGDIGHQDAARRLLNAIEAVLTAGRLRPVDMGGSAGTRELTDAIVEAIGR